MTNPTPTRELCWACKRISPVGFHVPDEVWKAVVTSYMQSSILCIFCFAMFGDEKMIDWAREIKFFPVSLAMHRHFATEHERDQRDESWSPQESSDG